MILPHFAKDSSEGKTLRSQYGVCVITEGRGVWSKAFKREVRGWHDWTLELCAPPPQWDRRISSRGKIGLSASLPLLALTSLFSLCVLISVWGANTCSGLTEFPSKAHFNPILAADWWSLGENTALWSRSGDTDVWTHHEVINLTVPWISQLMLLHAC